MRRAVLLSAVFLSGAWTPCSAEPTKPDIAGLVGRVGGEAAKTYLSGNSGSQIPPSALSPEQHSQLVEDTLKKYGQIRNSYYAAANAGSAMGVGGEAAFGLGALRVAGPPVLRVAFLLMASTTKSITDAGNAKILAAGREHGRRYLAEQKNEILSRAGVGSFVELRSKYSLDEIRNTLIQATNNFQDVRDRAGGDQILADHARDLLIDTIANVQPTILDALEQQDKQIEDFSKFIGEMKDYTDQTDARLQAHAESIAAIEGQVSQLTGAVAAVGDGLRQLGRDQAVIADFVFDEMDPRQKAESLKRGFISERFSCPPEQPDCKGPEVRDQLIVQFEREADIRDFVGTAGSIVGGLNDLNTIATNFGINSPELDKAVEIGNAAMGLATAYLSGNPLGAIAAVSGLFGQKQDPNAATMLFLKQIDRKLDIIIENQKVLLEAVNRLSEQMQKGFEALDNRLARMEFEQRRMSHGVRELIWKNWRSCYSVVEEARNRTPTGEYKFIDGNTQAFRSFESIKAVWQATGQSFRDCLKTVTDDMASLSAVKHFGNFIDARWAVNDRLIPDQATLKNPAEGGEWQSLLQQYESSLFNPALQISSEHRAKLKIGWATSFALLATPTGRTADLKGQIADYTATPFECFKANNRDERLYPLLCAAEPEPQAMDLLSRPILAELTIEIARWILILAPIADVYDQQDQRFLETVEELLDKPGNAPVGRRMIEKSIRVLDVAIAAYSQMYGGITALGVIDALDAIHTATEENRGELTSKAEAAINLLKNNPYLAENVATLLLERSAKGAGPNYQPPAEGIYREAYAFAERGGPKPGFLFEGVFPGVNFLLASDGAPAMRLSAGAATVDIPLPAPNQFVEGRLVYPPRFYELLNIRSTLFDRLFDYDILSYVPPEVREEFAVELVH